MQIRFDPIDDVVAMVRDAHAREPECRVMLITNDAAAAGYLRKVFPPTVCPRPKCKDLSVLVIGPNGGNTMLGARVDLLIVDFDVSLTHLWLARMRCTRPQAVPYVTRADLEAELQRDRL